jgi:hypothetical protein
MTPPEWDIKQEINWQALTVNSILEYIVYFYDAVKIDLGGRWGGVISICWVLQIGALSTLTNKKIYATVNSKMDFCWTNVLFELQPKYDTSWMGYWTGKILTSFDSKFHFGIYCLLLCICQRRTCYKNYNQNITFPEWVIEQERYWKVSPSKFNFGIYCLWHLLNGILNRK